jgi:hypothetical protein
MSLAGSNPALSATWARVAKPGEPEGYPLNPTYLLLRARPVGFVLRPVLSEVKGLSPKGQHSTLGKGREDTEGTPPRPPACCAGATFDKLPLIE